MGLQGAGVVGLQKGSQATTPMLNVTLGPMDSLRYPPALQLGALPPGQVAAKQFCGV